MNGKKNEFTIVSTNYIYFTYQSTLRVHILIHVNKR